MLLSDLLKGIADAGRLGSHEITDVTDNTKNVVPGCLFVCIEGKRFDGHIAAGDMLANGAAAILVERDLGLKKQIIVPDTREAYAMACANLYGRSCDRLRMIGITGTNGKTTTAFTVKSMLEHLGESCGLIGTVANAVGDKLLPAVLTTPDPHELHALFADMERAGNHFCVMEASSQALDQKRLAGIRFEAAALTNISQDHLDYHGTMEKYVEAKKMLFSAADKVSVNADDVYAGGFAGVNPQCLTYSCDAESDLTAHGIGLFADRVEYTLTYKGENYSVRFGVPGGFSVYNSLTALSCVMMLGYSAAEAVEALSFAGQVPGRLELLKTNENYGIVIDYAHTPDGLEKAITAVRGFTKGRVITVFGCGGDRDNSKRPKMGAVVYALSDVTVVTSDNPRTESPEAIIEEILAGIDGRENVYVEPDRTKAIAYALNHAREGDTVLLAGKGHETYQIIGTEKRHYDEREIAQMILAEKQGGHI